MTLDLAAMSKLKTFPAKAEFIPMTNVPDKDVAAAEKAGVKKPYALPSKGDATKEAVGAVGIGGVSCCV